MKRKRLLNSLEKKMWIGALLCILMCIFMMPAKVSAAGGILAVNGVNILEAEDYTVTCGDGTAVYNPDTQTLTLNDTTMDQSYNMGTYYVDSMIYCTMVGDLTINVKGNNVIGNIEDEKDGEPVRPTMYAINSTGGYSNGGIIITGDGTLDIYSTNAAVVPSYDDCIIEKCTLNLYGKVYGLNSQRGDIIIRDGATINAYDCIGMYSGSIEESGEGGISIKDSKVNVQAGENTGMHAQKDVIIENSTVDINVAGQSNCYNGLAKLNVINSKVTLKSVQYPALWSAGDVSFDSCDKVNIVSLNDNAVYAKDSNLSITDSSVESSSVYSTVLKADTNITIKRSDIKVTSVHGNGIYARSGILTIEDTAVEAIAADAEKNTLYGGTSGLIKNSWIENRGGTIEERTVAENSALFQDNAGTVTGNFTTSRDAEVSEDMTLSIPESASVTVAEGTTFTNNGDITLAGTFTNAGGTVICTNHTGGTPICTEKTKCGICGEPYGDIVEHKAVRKQAKEATYDADGNIEYWYCDQCGKYFSDETLAKEITRADTVIPKLNKPTTNQPANNPVNKPAKVTSPKVKKVWKSFVISWKKVSGATDYQVQFKKTGQKSWKNIKRVTNLSKTKWRTENYIKGKTYRYRIRAYKVVDGKKVYGAWSKVVKIKK